MNIVTLIQACIQQLPSKVAAAVKVDNSQEQNQAAINKPKPKLVLAYSGGVDSEILAHGLAQFAKVSPHFECLLVHVHHGLSANADTWAEHCLTQAKHYDLDCTVKRVEVKLAPRLSVEAQARSVRYEALLSELSNNDILMTAHHQDDQLETVLLALKRGLGPKGLSAMGKVQRFNQQHWIIRPLLDCSKDEIEAYAKRYEITHIQDESNFDDKYDRNFLRLDVIPKLKQRWPSIAATTSRSAELCALQQSVLDEEIALKLPNIQLRKGNDWVLDLERLAQYSSAWQSLLLRGHMDALGFAPPSKVQGEQILAQLLDAKADANVEIRLTDVIIKRFKSEGYFLLPQKNAQYAADKKGLSNIQLNKIEELINRVIELPTGDNFSTEACQTGLRLRLPLSSEQVSIEFALPGSTRCHPHNRSKGRELKKVWQECGLAPWKRGTVPLLCYDGKLVAAVGYWIEKSYLATADDVGLVLHIR
ncbi:tRNA(Ile)-lysidine synthetase [Shewanella halifaxensis HAW-EB4]|uniref:tRNA(Ile)-lysidine synthase n=1 Tax=Shewanella halifaxensis (strain HAW-EB4) TaxID=458817 RepID=B0TNK0_SHEHH|nr:tRNA lysidine(34) synthetase TilS [Shewanella halifaxensis]ABZ77514.1 tRNA(Ile)-lysidine synthetase [Shewanella halifaxensis HAW-EB4]